MNGKYSLRTDEQLIEWMRNGDEEGFRELYRRHHADLFRFSWHMTGSRHLAEEVVQETFLVLIRKPHAWVTDRGSVRAFLFGIARNHVLRRLEEHREFIEVVPEVQDARDLFADVERNERIDAVKQAILTLPPLYREAVVLCDMEEMSYEAAAHIQECPVGTMRSRLSRGRQMLAEKLKIRMAGNPV